MSIVSNDAAFLQRKIHTSEQLPCRTRGPEDYFPDLNCEDRDYARALCAGCPVLVECRILSILNGDLRYGIFGGMTPSERYELALDEGLIAEPTAQNTAAAA